MTMTQTQDAATIPDPALDSQTFKKHLMDQVRARGGTEAVDTKQLFQSMAKDTLEAFLELEMERDRNGNCVSGGAVQQVTGRRSSRA